MSRFAFIVGAWGVLPGCLYLDRINQRPSLTIENLSATATFRGDMVNLRADANDPEGDYISYLWRAYACSDAIDTSTCDDIPFADSALVDFSFNVPSRRANDLPVESVWVVLEGHDDLGAAARPRPELIIPIVDIAPTVVLAKQSKYNFVIGTPVDVTAKVGDDDDGPTRVNLTWTVSSPAPLSHALVDRSPPIPADPEDPAHLQFGKVFTPMGAGAWFITVAATDPVNHMTTEMIEINVVDDHAPCLAQLLPTVPPSPAALPIVNPTLFRVPIVSDDLDPYPLIANDPVFRATRFSWSLKAPGQSTHLVIPDAASNSYSIDPASYTPGDTLELRVEIYDRKNTAIPCVDGLPTCSTISEPTCLQRQTWRVEVR